MCAIFKRDFKAYFQNVVGWLFIAVVYAIFGLFFYAFNMVQGSTDVSSAVGNMAFILMITAPILTMRSFSEDRKSKVEQLILTSPISIGKIVVAKFLAMFAVYTIDIVAMIIPTLILNVFGKTAIEQSMVAILGVWLYGGAFIAMGMFFSSLTESQVISAVLTFVFGFAGYMMASIISVIPSNLAFFTKILNALDLYTPLVNMLGGTFSVVSLVYYLSVIVLFCFFTTQAIQKRRWSVSSNKISTSVFSSSLIIAGVALVVVINMFVSAIPTTITSVDCTANKIYKITDVTKKFLGKLDTNIEIYVLNSEKTKDTTIDKTLDYYKSMSKKISVKYIDITSNPQFYAKYTDVAPSQNSLIVVSKDSKGKVLKSKVIDRSDIYEMSADESSYYGGQSKVTGYDAEGKLTSAIEYVSMDEKELPKAYILTGHDELPITGSFLTALEKANVTTVEINLLKEKSVPSDAKCVIINSPTSDLSKEDAQKINDYVNKGGKIIVTCNYTKQDLENFNSVLANVGVTPVKGVVYENDTNHIAQNSAAAILPQIVANDYTSSVANKYILMYASVGLGHKDSNDKISFDEFLKTSDKAVAKVNYESATTSKYEAGDTYGPFALGLEATKKVGSKKTAKAVVFGSYATLNEQIDQMVAGNNSEMFANTVKILTGSPKLSASTIKSKSYTLSPLTIPALKANICLIICSVILPLILLASGIAIWLVRRRK